MTPIATPHLHFDVVGNPTVIGFSDLHDYSGVGCDYGDVSWCFDDAGWGCVVSA